MKLKTMYALAGTTAVALSQISLGSAVQAATNPFDTSSKIQPPGAADFSSVNTDFKTQFLTIANKAIDIILIIAGVLAVLFLIWSGIQYITSAGNPERAKTARAGIINAVIGIIVIVAAFFIVRIAVGAGLTVNNVNQGS